MAEILVDTSVWIDFFAGREMPHVVALEDAINRDDEICLCGVILAETLQGIRKDSDYRKTKQFFDSLLFLPVDRQTYIRAAELFRRLRKKGITISKPIDCMIAAVAVENDLPLLHNDCDFDQIIRHTDLTTIRFD